VVSEEFGVNMPKAPFKRGQTQILYRYLPEAIFEHDEYGLCKVEEIICDDITEMINKSALFSVLIDTLQKWPNEKFRERFPDPRGEREQKMYRFGQPREVLFNPYPTVLKCKQCHHVFEYAKLQRKWAKPRKCPRPGCDGEVDQMRFVEIHNCGRMQEMFVPPGCKTHGGAYIRFDDTGRIQTSQWYCGICKEPRKPRLTPCACEYSRSNPGFSAADKSLRLYPTSEPGLYIPHVVAFINFPEEYEKRLSQTQDALSILLARAWGILETKASDLVSERSKWKPGGESQNPELRQLIELLEVKDPKNEILMKYKKSTENPPGQDKIDSVKRLLSGAGLAEVPARKLVEHVSLLDESNLTGIETVAKRLRERGDNEEADRYSSKGRSVFEGLGFRDVYVINDFPIALTALGYTRITKDPKKSIFNPFPAREDGKIPLYVIPTETEGLWFHLDPTKVARWLVDNGFASGAPPAKQHDAWGWMYENVLLGGFDRLAGISPAAIAVEKLIHTMSHTVLQKIEWSGFASSSIGEYLLPETLSFVIYANRFAEAKIGGLTTLFEQRLSSWLFDVFQSGRDCVYDPLCSEDGGSCAGCLHREHNCSFFNNELSRSCLYGGPLPQDSGTTQERVLKGYWGGAEKLGSVV
jgi:hypothetical protein